MGRSGVGILCYAQRYPESSSYHDFICFKITQDHAEMDTSSDIEHGLGSSEASMTRSLQD